VLQKRSQSGLEEAGDEIGRIAKDTATISTKDQQTMTKMGRSFDHKADPCLKSLFNLADRSSL